MHNKSDKGQNTKRGRTERQKKVTEEKGNGRKTENGR